MPRHVVGEVDTLAAESGQRIVRLLCGSLPVCVASLGLDSRATWWSEQRVPLETSALSRWLALCGKALVRGIDLIADDATRHAELQGDPAVRQEPFVRFCVLRPIRDPSGETIALMAAFDTRAHRTDLASRSRIDDLAAVAAIALTSLLLAQTDPLTGVGNRIALHGEGMRSFTACRRRGLPVHALHFDLDRFKAVNESHGHQQGDRILSEFGGILKTCVRSSDLVVRLGGDEFAVMLYGADAGQAGAALARIQEAVARRNQAAPGAVQVHFSCGIAAFDSARHVVLDDLIADADADMFRRRRVQS